MAPITALLCLLGIDDSTRSKRKELQMATSGTPDIRMELFICRATAEWHPRVLSQIHNHLEVRRMMLNSEAAAFFRNISDLVHRYHRKALRY